MLTIRMQRKGRKGHAQFRVVVQDSRFNPKSGRVVAYVGIYDPHSKNATIDGEKVSQYLDKGAQPSDRVIRILQKEGINLPSWVKTSDPKERSVRNPEKRRSTTPKQEEEKTESSDDTADAKEAEQPTEVTAEEQPAAKAEKDS